VTPEQGGAPKPDAGRSPKPPAARVAPTPVRAPAGPSPAKPPAPARAISPRAPAVAPNDSSDDDSPGPTEVTRTTPQVAVEAALADFSAWRREAERKISQLEAEVLRLGSLTHRAPEPTRELPAFQPAVVAAPAVVLPAHELPRPSALPMWSQGATQAAAPTPVPNVAVSHVPAVVSIRPREEPLELQARPGELYDLPSALDGGRRKRLIVTLVVLILVIGMGALIFAAVASQGQHSH